MLINTNIPFLHINMKNLKKNDSSFLLPWWEELNWHTHLKKNWAQCQEQGTREEQSAISFDEIQADRKKHI